MQKAIPVLALLALVLASSAAAHVEPSPEKVPADGTSRITLTVEGEETVPAIRLTVQMPAGVTDVAPRGGRGWKPSAHGRIITWSGGKIAHGEEAEFRFRAHFPNAPGKVLVFPALVTYANGDVVHWIGAESSDTPAPRITLTAAKGGAQPPPPPPPVATTAVTDPGSDSGGNSWIWIFVVAAIVASLAAILLVRRRRA